MNDELKIRVIKRILEDAFESQWEGEAVWNIIGSIIYDIVLMDEEDEQ